MQHGALGRGSVAPIHERPPTREKKGVANAWGVFPIMVRFLLRWLFYFFSGKGVSNYAVWFAEMVDVFLCLISTILFNHPSFPEAAAWVCDGFISP